MPERLSRGRSVADLKEGETAYIIPWAIFPNLFGGGRIDDEVSINTMPGGTCDQKIKKQNGVILVERSILKRRLVDLLEGAMSDTRPSEIKIKIVRKI